MQISWTNTAPTALLCLYFLIGEQIGQDYDKVVETGGKKKAACSWGLGVGLIMIWCWLARFCPINDCFVVSIFLETLNSRDNTQPLLTALLEPLFHLGISLDCTTLWCRGKHGSYLTGWISFVSLLSFVKKKKKVYLSFTAVPQYENRSIWNCFTTGALGLYRVTGHVFWEETLLITFKHHQKDAL